MHRPEYLRHEPRPRQDRVGPPRLVKGDPEIVNYKATRKPG